MLLRAGNTVQYVQWLSWKNLGQFSCLKTSLEGTLCFERGKTVPTGSKDLLSLKNNAKIFCMLSSGLGSVCVCDTRTWRKCPFFFLIAYFIFPFKKILFWNTKKKSQLWETQMPCWAAWEKHWVFLSSEICIIFLGFQSLACTCL